MHEPLARSSRAHAPKQSGWHGVCPCPAPQRLASKRDELRALRGKLLRSLDAAQADYLERDEDSPSADAPEEAAS